MSRLRDVPLHRDLLRLGFMEARVDGRDPEASLFPEAVSIGTMGRNAEPFGSWFGLFRKHCGILNPHLEFHFWRHTAETLLLRAGVPQSHVDEILGHESEGRRSEMSAVYNHGMSIEGAAVFGLTYSDFAGGHASIGRDKWHDDAILLQIAALCCYGACRRSPAGHRGVCSHCSVQLLDALHSICGAEKILQLRSLKNL